jgi:hypothetical protein
MSHTTSIDIAPGIVVAGSGAPGFSGHAGLSFADYAGLTMHVVALRPDQYDVDRRMRVAVFAGGRLASAPGTIVGVGGAGACRFPCRVRLWHLLRQLAGSGRVGAGACKEGPARAPPLFSPLL